MINQISVATRSRKSEPLKSKEAFQRWVSEYAEAYGMTEEEVVNLALFRMEKERLERGN